MTFPRLVALRRAGHAPAWVLLLALSPVACRESTAPPRRHRAHTPTHHHGAELLLGKVQLAGLERQVFLLGYVDRGVETGVRVRPAGRASIRAWFVDQGGKPVTPRVRLVREGDALHAHLCPAARPAQLVLAGGGAEVRLSVLPFQVPFGPRGGVMAPLQGALQGWVELKLHDDEGDLELWLYRDREGTVPLRLPVATEPRVRFLEREGREAPLTVRDPQKNPDEEGHPTVVAGKTHYFVFPGPRDVDTSWLQGSAFSARVTVLVPLPGGTARTPSFRLVPHAHRP